MTGGGRDEHGCIGSAGYTWCDAKSKCIRESEEGCTAVSATACTCGDECKIPSTGASFAIVRGYCQADGSCTTDEPSCGAVATPVTAMTGGGRDEHGCIGSAGYTWCDAKS